MAAFDPDYDSRSPLCSFCGAPRALILILAASFGLFVAVGCGSLISNYVPVNEPWLLASAFAGPVAFMSGLYWLVARHL